MSVEIGAELVNSTAPDVVVAHNVWLPHFVFDKRFLRKRLGK